MRSVFSPSFLFFKFQKKVKHFDFFVFVYQFEVTMYVEK